MTLCLGGGDNYHWEDSHEPLLSHLAGSLSDCDPQL